MAWKLDDKRSIYGQLIEEIKRRIMTGIYEPGSRLPSVRDLAAEAGVNPNTMQRALAELEREGLLFSQRTAGRFVADHADRIRGMKMEAAQKMTAEFIRQMEELGFSKDEILSFISQEKAGESR